ncbi:four helix bundle protein [bacterium]|nr:four helix bundle protein [bacterium]
MIFYNKDFRNRSFQDQIMRAGISIANNIAEGNER